MEFHLNHAINSIAILGLTIEIIGVIMLFYNGLPSAITEGESYLLSEISLPNLNEGKIRRNARWGLRLIIIGSLFQILSYVVNLSF